MCPVVWAGRCVSCGGVRRCRGACIVLVELRGRGSRRSLSPPHGSTMSSIPPQTGGGARALVFAWSLWVHPLGDAAEPPAIWDTHWQCPDAAGDCSVMHSFERRPVLGRAARSFGNITWRARGCAPMPWPFSDISGFGLASRTRRGHQRSCEACTCRPSLGPGLPAPIPNSLPFFMI